MHFIISIHPRDKLSPTFFQSPIRCLDDPPMLLQQHSEPTILLHPPLQNFPTAILRTIINRHHLKIFETLARDTLQRLHQGLGGIVNGH